MTRKMGYHWHLRKIMATRGMFATSDLVPLLAERGVHLSREQVFRLVTQSPQRLSMDTLAALCDILDVGVDDLIEIAAVNEQITKSVNSSPAPKPAPTVRRSTIRRPQGL